MVLKRREGSPFSWMPYVHGIRGCGGVVRGRHYRSLGMAPSGVGEYTSSEHHPRAMRTTP